MKKGGIHILDAEGALTLENIKKIWEARKNVDTIAEKYIKNAQKFDVLFSNSLSDETSKNVAEEAYHYAELEMNSIQILHQRDCIWSIFDREVKDQRKKAEQVSKKLFSCRKYPGMRVFTIEASDALFTAQGYLDGTLFFDFQAGSLLHRIGYLPLPVQKQYLETRHFEKSNPQLIADFFQTDRPDWVQKIQSETDPERLAALFEEMLSMQLFYDFDFYTISTLKA